MKVSIKYIRVSKWFSVLDWNHDHYYLDPCIFYEVPSTGYYWVQVMGFPYPATASEELGGGSCEPQAEGQEQQPGPGICADATEDEF